MGFFKKLLNNPVVKTVAAVANPVTMIGTISGAINKKAGDAINVLSPAGIPLIKNETLQKDAIIGYTAAASVAGGSILASALGGAAKDALAPVPISSMTAPAPTVQSPDKASMIGNFIANNWIILAASAIGLFTILLEKKGR